MRDVEKKILKHLKERGWDKLRPVDLAKSIMIEGAELLEIFQWENLSLDEVKKDKKKMEEIKKELADVLTYGLNLAVTLGFDSEKMIHEQLAKVAKKYPAKLLKNNGKQDPGTENIYWKIKKAHRKKSS